MKRVTIVILLSLSLVGCHKAVSAPVPGQLNTFDAYIYRVLLDSQAAINSFKGSPSAQNPSVKPILNQAIADYDIVEAAYQTWHAAGGTGDASVLTQGVNKLQGDITGIAAAGGK